MKSPYDIIDSEQTIWVMHHPYDGDIIWYGSAKWCSYSIWIIPGTEPYTHKYVDSA